ncbi:MAG: SDR family oxidoreductase [Proteobacteria bacterium]|nr:SDR family oxidoreductase [Pseudomonadota bacterium]MBU1708913.1 SDR family oxidoreductase [Pseudomonadota bacterium]
MKIHEKTALVLGSAKGIGKAIGLAFARAQANVVFTYFDWPEESRQTIKEVSELAGDHLIVEVDLRDPDQIQDLVRRIRDKYGSLDILINNIERGGMPVVHGEYTPDQWDLEMATTLKAKRWVFHHCLPLLKKSGQGAVITLSSIAGITGRSGPAGLIFNDGYAAANRAVSSFTETWARQGAPEVRVNELMLGFFETRHAEQTRGWGLLKEEQRQAIKDHILLKRTGRIEEIVKSIFFMIEDATYMTGSVIRLDGGYILGGDHMPPMPQGVEQ